jgi:hypothetical protein
MGERQLELFRIVRAVHQVARRRPVDIVVARVEQSAVWDLTDLLGRHMGTIEQEQKGFYISPIGEAVKTMQLVHRGPHASLDKALAEIETRTRGVCRRE